MHKLRFRQIHLDFHTSEAIGGIGAEFDKKQFQEALKAGHVDSITCFSKCHHGWSYHPTQVGKMHPHLGFDLLRAQYDAAKEIGVNVPVYLSAGFDNAAWKDHPEWRQIGANGQFISGSSQKPVDPGYHLLCFNGPYLDYLCGQIREAVELFPDCDGIFLDIIVQEQCCCKWCMALMEEKGLDATVEADRIKCAELAIERYYRETTAASKSLRDDMPVFHNSGHIQRGNRDILDYFSHLELESLPTGGWGYDHFPVSAKYCMNLPHDVLGMTGKFHTTWGEFGGYKHPNALKYECVAMLAYGAKCCVGDQLHPSGEMDESTYKLIGSAYAEVEAKEPWCVDAENVADIGLLSSEAVNGKYLAAREEVSADIGAGRILLEGHFLFDVLDAEMDFSKYKMLVLPDDIRIDEALKTKLDAYLSGEGKLFLTGTSGLDENGKPLFGFGADFLGQSEFQPDYILPNAELRPSFVDSPLVMYLPSQRIKATTGESLGDIYDPYFNRTYRHFCSHQHAPAKPESSGFDCGVRNGNILYLAHSVFSIYRGLGAVAYKEYIINAIRSLLGEPTVKVSLPSTGRVSLMHQKEHSRHVLHLLYANTVNRGGPMELSGGTLAGKASIEVIDELLPLHDVNVSLSLPEKVESIKCVPDGTDLEFVQNGSTVEFTLPKLLCHQMIELRYS
ncbi:MAG: alpha-amylase family protein [Verrucomicrobiota bacterium]